MKLLLLFSILILTLFTSISAYDMEGQNDVSIEQSILESDGVSTVENDVADYEKSHYNISQQATKFDGWITFLTPAPRKILKEVFRQPGTNFSFYSVRISVLLC